MGSESGGWSARFGLRARPGPNNARGPDGCSEGVWLPARERETLGALILAAVKGDPEAWAMVRP